MNKNYSISYLRISMILLAFVLTSTCFTSKLSAQNVGVGETVPALTLDIKGSRATEGIIINNTNTANKSHIQFKRNGVAKYTMGFDNNDTTFKVGTTAITTGTFVKMKPSTGEVDFNNNVAVGGPSNATLHITNQLAPGGGTVRVQNDAAGDGDPSLEFNTSGTSQYSIGYDESATSFKISASNTLGTTDRLTINSAGNIGIATTSPTSNLEVKGSMAVNAMRSVSSASATNVTLDATDFLVKIQPTAAVADTVKLPAAAGCPGRMYVINHRATNGTVIVDGNAAETVGGVATISILGNKTEYIISDGVSDWITVP